MPTNRSRTTRRIAIIAGSVLLTGAAVAGGLRLVGSTEEAVAQEVAAPSAISAEVETRDLVETEKLQGTVGYGDVQPIMSRTNGTVTAVPTTPLTVDRGTELLRVDDRPIVAMFGDAAAWRQLAPGVVAGTDVRQLEENLATLGHSDDGRMVVDDTWDRRTTAAVKSWQQSIGVDPSGRIDLGQIVFVPGRGTVTDVTPARGATVGEGMELARFRLETTARSVHTRSAGSLTSVPRVGSRVDADAILFEIDGEPTVALMARGVHNERTLRNGVAPGLDIMALEENLVALGHDPDGEVEIDLDWDAATTAAVNRWHAAHGRAEDDRTEPHDFVFASDGEVIVGAHHSDGDEVDSSDAILDVGESLLEVTATAETDQEDLVEVGSTVDVKLPDDRHVSATIESVARVTAAAEQGSTTSLEVGLTVGTADLADVEPGSITVEVDDLEAEQVMAVPTAALVGLVGGGQAVEVQRADGTTQLVAVELGRDADGWVEITNGSLSVGDRVVVPR